MTFRTFPLFLLAAGVCFAAGPEVSVARWPGGRTAAVSLTFDDGIDSHLDIAGPILRKHHLNGSFFISTGREPWRKRIDGWRKLAAEGNEIANHTVEHPCLLDRITPHAQDYTPAMMEAEVRDASREIHEKIGGRRGMAFAFPCGNLTFGRPADQARNSVLYLKYISECCFAARAYTGSRGQDPDDLNILNVLDLGFTACRNGVQLLSMLDPVLQDHSWGIYTFHGVGGDWLPVSGEAFDELTGYLESHPDIWVPTFGDGVRYIQERRALGISTGAAGGNTIEAELTWPLDPAVYDLPITLEIRVPGDWARAAARGDGRELVSKLARNEKGAVLLVDVPPQTKHVVVTPER